MSSEKSGTPPPPPEAPLLAGFGSSTGGRSGAQPIKPSAMSVAPKAESERRAARKNFIGERLPRRDIQSQMGLTRVWRPQ